MISHLLAHIERLSDVLLELLDKRRSWFLFGFSILYLSVTFVLTSHKMMWNDELYTYYISSLPSISQVWSVLMTGAEQTPPLFYVITRASFTLFGANEISVRVPEVIGFWIMSVCLFWFVSRRISALYGLIAMLFPLTTGAFQYAYEARPYGLVMGFAGLALLSWQSAADKGDRRIWLAGLSLSLAAAVSCHYYAVFVFIPLALGEVVRSVSRRRVDLLIWLMFFLGATPLVGFLPLIERATGYSSTFWAKPEWISVPGFYHVLLTPAAPPLTAMLLLSAIYPAAAVTHHQSAESKIGPPSAIPLHEWAAALGFILIPAVAVPLCMFFTGAYTARYSMPAVIGFSIVAAFAFRRLFFARPAPTAIMALTLCVYFLLLGTYYHSGLVKYHSDFTRTEDFLRSRIFDGGANGLPIAVSDPWAFMTLAHYASPDIARRVIYLADTDASLRYIGHNSVERGMLDMIGPWFRLKVEEYHRFINTGGSFLVYSKPAHFLNWLLSDLGNTGMRIELLGGDRDAILLLAHPKSKTDIPATFPPPAVKVR